MTSWAAAAKAAASSSFMCDQPSASETKLRWSRRGSAPLEVGVVASAPPAVSSPGRDVPGGDVGAYGILGLLQTQLSSSEPSIIFGLVENEVTVAAMNNLFKELRGRGPHEVEADFLSMVPDSDARRVETEFMQLSFAGEAKRQWPMKILRADGSGAYTEVV